VYSSAELTCDQEAPRRVSALSLMNADAEWIDVQVVTSGAQENVRVRRYRRTADQPPDASLISPEVAARAARAALGAKLTVDHVAEASRNVTPRVLEALLFETKATFPLNSRRLIALADAGVADTVIDLMVAFSFPQKFEVRRSAGGSSGAFPGFGMPGFGFGGFGPFGFADGASPWFFDPYYSYYSPFGYSRGGFWDGYYYALSNGITVNQNTGGSIPETHGRVINGSGYTQVVSRPPVATRVVVAAGAAAIPDGQPFPGSITSRWSWVIGH
jgi:hypothetical protein